MRSEGQGLGGWPPDAIHDTVATIVHKPPYGGLPQSLLGRLLHFLGDWIDRFLDFVSKTPGGRYIAIAVAVLLVLVVVARVVLARRLRDDADGSGARGSAGRARRDFWSESRRLAEQGQYMDAAHALYLAVLERTAARDRIRLHSSKTSGDYSRELRARSSPRYEAFRRFSRRFDHVIFGVGACSAEDYATLVREAEPLIQDAIAA